MERVLKVFRRCADAKSRLRGWLNTATRYRNVPVNFMFWQTVGQEGAEDEIWKDERSEAHWV